MSTLDAATILLLEALRAAQAADDAERFRAALERAGGGVR